MADELARGGSQVVDTTIDESVKPPISYSKNHSSNFRKMTLGNCHLTGNFKHIDWSLHIRYLTSRWDKSVPDYFRLCVDEEEVETIEHVLCTCLMLSNKIHKLFGRWEIATLKFLSDTDRSRYHLHIFQSHSQARQTTPLSTLLSINIFFSFSLLPLSSPQIYHFLLG